MSALLAYSHSACLSEKKQAEINQQVKKNRKEFCRGFEKGTKISITIYSIYRVAGANSAYAADSCSDPGKVVPAVPENHGAVQPQPAPAHQVKPGFKPLSEGPKGAFVGGASAVCGAALQSGDFYLGAACAFLLVVGGIVINRPHVQNP